MAYREHVNNGRILLDKPAQLPEGAAVNVQVTEQGVTISRPQRSAKPPEFKAIEMAGGPLSDDIIRDRR